MEASYRINPASAKLNPVNNASTSCLTITSKSSTTTSSANSKLLSAIVNGCAIPSAAVKPNAAMIAFNAVLTCTSRVVNNCAIAVGEVAWRASIPTSRLLFLIALRVLTCAVAAWTAETISATEAERAAVAASLAGWGEEGVRDAAVDSVGCGGLVGCTDGTEGMWGGRNDLKGRRRGCKEVGRGERRGQHVRIAARAGWMLDVKPVRMSTEDASSLLPVLGLASGVGAERTVRKVLARARTERENLMLAGG